jgi:hypothetical protein
MLDIGLGVVAHFLELANGIVQMIDRSFCDFFRGFLIHGSSGRRSNRTQSFTHPREHTLKAKIRPGDF